MALKTNGYRELNKNVNIVVLLQSEYDTLAKELSNDSISLQIVIESFSPVASE